MAVSYRSAGTIGYSTGDVTATLPANVATGEYLLLLVGSKPGTATSTTPAGWTYLGGVASTSGVATGADVGPTVIEAYGKVATGTETTVVVENATNSVTWVHSSAITNSTGAWDVAVATGEDATGGIGWSAAHGPLGLASGDLVINGVCIPTDVTTPAQFSAETITASGYGFAAGYEQSEPDSSLGNDIGGFVYRWPVTSGASGTASPTVTATVGGTTTNVYGPSILVRLREAPGGIVTLSSAGTLTGVGAPSVTEAAALAGEGGLTGSGAPAAPAAGDMAVSGSGALSLVGSPATSGTVSLTGSGALARSGSPTTGLALPLAASGSLAGSGAPRTVQSRTLAGAGTITLSGSAAPSGTLALAASGSLAATGRPSVDAVVGLASTGAVTASGSPSMSGGVDIDGVGTLAVDGAPDIHSSAGLGGVGGITLSGVVIGRYPPSRRLDSTTTSRTVTTRPESRSVRASTGRRGIRWQQ